jgi:DNA-binding winged helix-turn-helix (wHTH) protein
MRLRFADCDLDPGCRSLIRGGRQVHLTPKAWQLLELLLEQRPRPVAKPELMGKLWPDTFVSEGSLSNLVFELRTALGDNSRESRIVRTMHSVGYAFMAEVISLPSLDSPVKIRRPLRLVASFGSFELMDGENLIGRDESCRVCVPSATVSRVHARVLASESQVTIEDLSSKNGTRVADRRIDGTTQLHDGDTVRVGDVQLVFRDSFETLSTESLEVERQV